jgi:hypothetical protein
MKEQNIKAFYVIFAELPAALQGLQCTVVTFRVGFDLAAAHRSIANYCGKPVMIISWQEISLEEHNDMCRYIEEVARKYPAAALREAPKAPAVKLVPKAACKKAPPCPYPRDGGECLRKQGVPGAGGSFGDYCECECHLPKGTT